MESPFISSNDRAVLFQNFQVNHTELRPEHEAFINNILVPFYIHQIEALGFSDKTLTIRPIGKASATGRRDHNQELSDGRARAIGASVKRNFDLQKSRGKFAQKVDVVVLPHGEGDADERELLGSRLNALPQSVVEANSNQFRAVLLSMRVQHVVNEDDQKVFCRQILDVKLVVQKVPANLLEQKIDELQRKVPPELMAALKEFFDAAKGLAKTLVEQLLKAAEFSAPELFLIFKEIDFLVPSDVALQFEFKDSRARTTKYNFIGSANKVDLSLLDVLAQALSLLKWLTRLPQGLEEMEREVEETGKKLNLSHEQIDALKAAIDKAKKLAGNAKKIFDAITAPNSLFRKVVGDGPADLIIKAVNAGSGALLGEKQVATDWALVSFESQGVFDIFSFAGAARTVTQETVGKPTTVALDFAARKNEPLLGFQAHVTLERKFTLSLTLGSFEIANGALVSAAP
jgi:hypothetical protein